MLRSKFQPLQLPVDNHHHVCTREAGPYVCVDLITNCAMCEEVEMSCTTWWTQVTRLKTCYSKQTRLATLHANLPQGQGHEQAPVWKGVVVTFVY